MQPTILTLRVARVPRAAVLGSPFAVLLLSSFVLGDAATARRLSEQLVKHSDKKIVTRAKTYLESTQSRLWKSQDGKFSVTAQYVGHDDTTVTLRKSDDTEIKVPLEKLGTLEQMTVKKISRLEDQVMNDGKPILERETNRERAKQAQEKAEAKKAEEYEAAKKALDELSVDENGGAGDAWLAVARETPNYKWLFDADVPITERRRVCVIDLVEAIPVIHKERKKLGVKSLTREQARFAAFQVLVDSLPKKTLTRAGSTEESRDRHNKDILAKVALYVEARPLRDRGRYSNATRAMLTAVVGYRLGKEKGDDKLIERSFANAALQGQAIQELLDAGMGNLEMEINGGVMTLSDIWKDAAKIRHGLKSGGDN
jgi:hypothetical protein